MANLLTSDAYKEMMRIQRARFVLVGALFLLALALLSALSLLPSYILLRMNGVSVSVARTPPSSTTTPSTASDRVILALAQQHVAALSPFVASSTHASRALIAALNTRPAGISITHITYTTLGMHGTIVVSGTAHTRQSVEAYRQALSSSATFAGVSIPVGALAGLDNGKFSATLTGDF